jgi:hypothetical protein
MKTYQIGETVTLKGTMKKSNTLYNPTNGVVVSVFLIGTAAAIINEVTVTPESTGVYTYDLDTTSYVAGKYRFRMKGTDGIKISKKDGTFALEA